MTLQLARLFMGTSRIFDDRRLIGGVFLDMVKRSKSYGLMTLYEFTNVNSRLTCWKLYHQLHCRPFHTSFKSAASARRIMRAGVSQGNFVSLILFTLYVTDTAAPYRYVLLALYADSCISIATYRSISLIFVYLHTSLGSQAKGLYDCYQSLEEHRCAAC
jgi:hypothetical protein